VVEGSSRGIFRKADGGSGIGLGIAIHEESGVFRCSKTGGQIYSRGCFADAALLVCDRDDTSQTVPRRENLAKAGEGCKMFHVEQDVAGKIEPERQTVPHGTLSNILQWSPTERDVPRGTFEVRLG
jgi:hypothetical protein